MTRIGLGQCAIQAMACSQSFEQPSLFMAHRWHQCHSPVTQSRRYGTAVARAPSLTESGRLTGPPATGTAGLAELIARAGVAPCGAPCLSGLVVSSFFRSVGVVVQKISSQPFHLVFLWPALETGIACAEIRVSPLGGPA